MKTIFWLFTFTALVPCLGVLAQEAPSEEEANEGKVRYSLIFPEEKTPETVKQTEQNPFGGVQDPDDLTAASSEEAQIEQLLRSLPVVGNTSGGTVLLGDIILRLGQLVPAVLPSQTCHLRVHQVSSDAVVFAWVEKKPTGLQTRTFTLDVDTTPQVATKLPGHGASSNRPFGQMPSSRPGIAVDSSRRTPRATVVNDTSPNSAPPAVAQPESSNGSSLLKMFFGTGQQQQVKNPAPAAPPPANDATKK